MFGNQRVKSYLASGKIKDIRFRVKKAARKDCLFFAYNRTYLTECVNGCFNFIQCASQSPLTITHSAKLRLATAYGNEFYYAVLTLYSALRSRH
jgi:hypothetical protein